MYVYGENIPEYKKGDFEWIDDDLNSTTKTLIYLQGCFIINLEYIYCERKINNESCMFRP